MMQLFDFDAIALNKQGKKSDAQIKEIKEAANPGMWLYGGLGVLVLGGCSYAALVGMNGGGSNALNVLLLILAAAGLFASLRGFKMWNLRRRLLKEPVLSSAGTVSFKKMNAVREMVDSSHFSAETDDGTVLHPVGLAGINPKLPPGTYRFYHLKPQHWLLAAEPLSSEAELRANMNALLALTIGYNPDALEQFRQEARTGALQTVEGAPNRNVENETISLPNSSSTLADNVAGRKFYCTLGGMRFQVSGDTNAVLFEDLPYRAYFRPEKPDKLVALELV